MNAIDPFLVRAAEQHVEPGMVVWDVGANLGLFTFAAAAIAGKSGAICAFEPDPWLQKLLIRSAAMQSESAHITILPMAVAAELGRRSFAIARRARSASHLLEYGTSQTGGIREIVEVPAVTLDSMLASLPVPDLIKIDIEGAELEALRGAERVLRSRPVILCEVAGENSAEVSEMLKQAGYRLIDGETLMPTNHAPYFTIAISAG